MSSTIPALPAPSAVPAKAAAKPPAAAPPAKTSETTAPDKKAVNTLPRLAEHRATSALSPADVGYVDSLLGVAPAQIMEYILLKTGIPQPANLGQDVDTSA